MDFYDQTFSNCNAQVTLHLSNWMNDRHRYNICHGCGVCNYCLNDEDDENDENENEFMSEEEARKIPIAIEWKNLKSGEEKTYLISTGTMTDSTRFGEGDSTWITLSPNGRYIAMWYNKMNIQLERGEVFMMVIDTETQELTDGSSEEFGEFIDKSSNEYYHGSCCVRILDNGLLHIVTVSECYENYLMDPKTNTVLFDFGDFIGSQGKFDHIGEFGTPEFQYNKNQFFLSIVTPESLLLIGAQECLEEGNEVFEYVYGGVRDDEVGKMSFKKMSRQALRELAKNYTMFPFDITD